MEPISDGELNITRGLASVAFSFLVFSFCHIYWFPKCGILFRPLLIIETLHGAYVVPVVFLPLRGCEKIERRGKKEKQAFKLFWLSNSYVFRLKKLHINASQAGATE